VEGRRAGDHVNWPRRRAACALLPPGTITGRTTDLCVCARSERPVFDATSASSRSSQTGWHARTCRSTSSAIQSSPFRCRRAPSRSQAMIEPLSVPSRGDALPPSLPSRGDELPPSLPFRGYELPPSLPFRGYELPPYHPVESSYLPPYHPVETSYLPPYRPVETSSLPPYRPVELRSC
jgi:hypothetical protein